ncbi:unnamed protein product [Alopecurus aequalis]
MGKHGDAAMTPEKAMERIEALSDLLVTIAQGVAEEERDGAAEAAGHNDDRSLDRLCRLRRLMEDLAAEEKLLRLAIDRMASEGGARRPTRKRKPNSRYPAADWTSSSSTGDNGAEPKPPPSTSS